MKSPQINTLPRIDQVWLALSVDDDGSEGVCAIRIDGTWMPLVAADARRLEFIREQARLIAEHQQRIVRIATLTSREDIDQFDGRISK